jgi:excisionase family DNA binding protein
MITRSGTNVNGKNAGVIKMEKLTLTVEETAKMLGIGRNSAYEAVARGEIPVIRVGKRLLVPKAALEKLLNCNQTKTAGPS